jgi:hypothetical protein
MKVVSRKHKGMDILVKWTPGHMEIAGNVKADEEAKKAATEGSSLIGKLPVSLRKALPWSRSAVHQEYHSKLKHTANVIWVTSPRYNRVARIDPAFSHSKFAKLTCNLHRNHPSLLF